MKIRKMMANNQNKKIKYRSKSKNKVRLQTMIILIKNSSKKMKFYQNHLLRVSSSLKEILTQMVKIITVQPN